MKKPQKHIRVAINGFGRIGRSTFRYLSTMPEVDIIAVNDLTDPHTLAYLYNFDTMLGRSKKPLSSDATHLLMGKKKVLVTAVKDPGALPWKDQKIDVVVESTGRFVDPVEAGRHLTAGAKRVIISAPAKGKGAPTIVIGVNEDAYQKQAIINNASCTTNCIAPIAAIMHATFGVQKAMMTTIHSYTADQVLVDGPHKDLRRGRSAAMNIVPTTTGAAIATGEAVPPLRNRFAGLSIRVPTALVSLSDFTFLTKKKVTIEEVNQAFVAASKRKRYQGVLTTTTDPVVSSDFIGNTHSAIVDLSLTDVVDGNMVKVIAWYDNESGYSLRLAEEVVLVGRSIS